MTEGLLTSETPEEKAYFEGKGVVPEAPVETPTEQPDKAPDAAPEEKPAEALDPTAEPAKEADKEPDLRTVPYVALREERQKRQKEREERLKLEGRLQIMEQEWRKSRDPAPEQPKELDPLAKLESVHKFAEEERQRQAHEGQRRALLTQYETSAREYEAEQPDFRAAYDHLVSSRVAELREMGHDAATAQEIAQNNELAIVNLAFSQGANPAERLYKLAKLRGYTPKKADAPKDTAQQKLATVEKGQQASKSLSQAAGSATKTNSLQALADMSDDEFDKATVGKKWENFWK